MKDLLKKKKKKYERTTLKATFFLSFSKKSIFNLSIKVLESLLSMHPEGSLITFLFYFQIFMYEVILSNNCIIR